MFTYIYKNILDKNNMLLVHHAQILGIYCTNILLKFKKQD